MAQFTDGFIEKISNLFDADTLKQIYEMLIVYENDFEISRKSTELAIVETFPQCAKVYLATRKVEGMSVKTIKSYGYTLREFFSKIQIPFDKVAKANVIEYLYGKECSDRTKSQNLTVIKTFYEWAYCEGYVKGNPCKTIKPIKYKKQEKEHLTDVELEMLRSACNTPREKAMVELFYSTGCRVSEIVEAKRSDIDFATCEMKVTGKGNKERIVYLNAKCEIALKKYFLTRNDDYDCIFVRKRVNEPIKSTKSIEDEFKRLGIEAGITKHIYPHMIRRTNATLSLSKGMEIQQVQRILGHADINTTLRYAKVDDEEVKRKHRICVV